MSFQPAESSKKILDFYRRYLLTTFQTNNEIYNQQLRELLSDDNTLARGPFISLNDPFLKDKSIREMVDENHLSKEFLKMDSFHPDRKLYAHQVKAILKATKKENMIVTTGTGSGKTECFLIPLINELLEEMETGTLDPGVRALLIYPMNALVNDQIKRLRELFKDGDQKITFGRYTGETEEEYKRALSKFREIEKKEPLKCELISREQMRETPPNILITNYAMLEYLLLRPNDDIFFNNNYASKWKYVILDEAHTYNGTKGIEVSMLLKRLKATLNRDDIQFILTSATLGDEDSGAISFAESLCDVTFNEGSVIRSSLQNLKLEPTTTHDFQIFRDLAQKIRENGGADSLLMYLEEKGIKIVPSSISEESLEKTLYFMILHDSFFQELRKQLINQTKTLHELSEVLTFSDQIANKIQDITDFVTVASYAKNEGDRIFEAKYHMFLKGIEGVYVTLEPSNKLFLNKMETYPEESQEFKVFEISFCHNCNAIYLTGQTENGFFCQDKKYDLEGYKPEVYLLSGNSEEELDFENIEKEDIESSNPEDNFSLLDENKHIICSKCAEIKKASSLRGIQCGHGEQYFNEVTRVKNKGEFLNSCPCCHSINTGKGITRPFYLGTEAATAVIATGLYNELPKSIVTKKVIDMKNEFFIDTSPMIKEEITDIVSQFIAFSDSVQGASFFSSYLENTYRDNLMKRAMVQVYENNKLKIENGMSIPIFVNSLQAELEKNKIYPLIEGHDFEKEAWMAVLREFVNFKAKNSLQNKGVLYFDLDVSIKDIGLNKEVLGLNENEILTLFKILGLEFIKNAAIDIPISVTKPEWARISYSGYQKGFVEDKKSSSYKNEMNWLPLEGKQNTRTRYLKKIFPDWDDSKIHNFLRTMWKVFDKCKIISSQKGTEYRLNVKDFIKIKPVKQLYICRECQKITPYNLKGLCSNPKCTSELERYDYNDLTKDDHYAWIMKNLTLCNLISKEHTGQLDSERAYDYQNRFKNQKINVLSCSTTFEMGVDLGSLETVFMRNVPPTPANYIQRAGRAGRSLKSAAYALTFCKNASHDLHYFNDPVTMIKGSIHPPIFNTSNEKIVLRHIFASAFSFFWKREPECYTKNVGSFFEKSGYEKFKKYLEQHPKDLKNYLFDVVNTLEPKLLEKFDIENFGWIDRLFSEDKSNFGTFWTAKTEYDSDINELTQARASKIEELQKAEGGDTQSWQIGGIDRSIQTIKDQKLIEFLSRNNLIPKYGFPVDTVELKKANTNTKLKGLELVRDLSIAISEYAPESEIVADGKLITSRYVKPLKGHAWPTYRYAECDNCHTLNKSLSIGDNPLPPCHRCGKELPFQREYIIPKFGFIMDNKEPKPVGTDKPEKTYRGEIHYTGDEKNISYYEYNVCGKRVIVGPNKMDELVVLNTSNFYICRGCGYGTIKNKFTKSIKESHQNPYGYPCPHEFLSQYALGHEFQTDIVMLRFITEDTSDHEKALTVLYALLEGLSRHLSVERTELSGCLHWYVNEETKIGNYAFVLFDNTPGGAGYVRLLEGGAKDTLVRMLQESYKIVKDCQCGKDTACYNCLLNYYNQAHHKYLKREYAIDFLESVLNGMSEFECFAVSKT